MQSESARVTTRAEAAYRVAYANAVPRRVTVIALDAKAEPLVRRLAAKSWMGATFLSASAFAAGAHSHASLGGWLADLAGRAQDLVTHIEQADLVVMIATAGENAAAASMIGEACSLQRKTTTGLIVGGTIAAQAAMAKTLSDLRPWSLMLVSAASDDYVEDMLVALRA